VTGSAVRDPLLGACDNTGWEPLAWVLRHGSARRNTEAHRVTTHEQFADAVTTMLPVAGKLS
jgi:hypothetical protein